VLTALAMLTAETQIENRVLQTTSHSMEQAKLDMVDYVGDPYSDANFS